MIQYDLVENGLVVKERVRFNAASLCHNHKVTHGDVAVLDPSERIECGFYNRIDITPKYDGRFQVLGNTAIEVDDYLHTVTHTTAIHDLDVDECKRYLIKLVDYYYSATDPEVYDRDANRESHLSAIRYTQTRQAAIIYDASTGWPSIPSPG